MTWKQLYDFPSWKLHDFPSWKENQIFIDSVSCMEEGPGLPTCYNNNNFPMQMYILKGKQKRTK